MRTHQLALLGLSLSLTTAFTAAHAAPIATLDRHGAWVSVEAYGPNVVHITIAADKAQALKAPGHGILADHADASAFHRSHDRDGDTFASSALSAMPSTFVSLLSLSTQITRPVAISTTAGDPSRLRIAIVLPSGTNRTRRTGPN